MKIIRPKEDTKLAYLAMQDLPKTLPGAIYVRQSKMAQKEKNVHSYEMQTDKFEQHFRDLGFTGTIEIVEDDEGTSGTLDIHKILSTTELDGTRKEGRRGYTRTKAEALLKDRITGPEDLDVYAFAGKGIYECIKVNSLKSHEYQFAIKYDVVDEIFSRHLLAMLDTWTGYDTWEDKPEGKANKKEQQMKAIQAQIAEAEANMEAIVKQIEDKENPPPASLKARL